MAPDILMVDSLLSKEENLCYNVGGIQQDQSEEGGPSPAELARDRRHRSLPKEGRNQTIKPRVLITQQTSHGCYKGRGKEKTPRSDRSP